MNERIKELAEQATKKYDRLGNEIPFAQPDLEKFAELIVRECARIGELKEQGYSEYDPDISVGWYMRQHFGVEDPPVDNVDNVDRILRTVRTRNK